MYALGLHMCITMYICMYSILLCNNTESSKELRELAAGIIISNPDKYSTAMLGKSSEEYTKWLLREQSWGGMCRAHV